MPRMASSPVGAHHEEAMGIRASLAGLFLALAALQTTQAAAQGRPPIATPPPAEAVLRSARQLQESGRPDAALREIGAYLARPGHRASLDLAVIRLEAARAGVAAERPDAARTHLLAATRLIEQLRPEQPLLARFQRELARVHERLGDIPRAGSLLQDTLTGLRSHDAAAAAEAANALGVILTELARPEQALLALQVSLDLLFEAGITGEPVVTALVNVTNAELEAGRVDAARQAAERARLAAEGNPQLAAVARFALALVMLRESDLLGAETILVELAQNDRPDNLRGHALNLLATSRFNRGQHPEAAEAAFRALDAYRDALGDRHPAFGRALHTLGIIHVELGAPAAARAFLERSIAVARAAFGQEAVQTHLSGVELAALEVQALSGVESAERRARAALGAMQATALPDRRPEALATVVLGRVAEARRQIATAARLYRRAQATLETARGPNTPDLGFSLVRLGRMLTRAGQYAEAAPPLDRAITIYERVGGAGTVRLAEAMTARAELRAVSGDRRGALEQIRRAYTLLSDRVAAGEAPSGAGEAQHRSARALFAAQAMLLRTLIDLDPAALEEAFAASQSSLISRAGEALRRSSLRIMAGAGSEAALLRAPAEAAESLRQTDALVLEAAAKPGGSGELQRLQTLRAEQLRSLQAASTELRRRNPALAEFLQPRPARLNEVREALADDEAVLAPLISEDQTILWVITRSTALAVPVDLSRDALSALVDRIRGSLDLSRPGGPPAFARDAAEALHAALVGPAEATGAIANVSHVLLVPDGALQRLPPHLLARPGGGWLVDRYATSILPSLSAFASVREAARRSSMASRALLGVGDPRLSRYGAAAPGSRGVPASVRNGLSALSELPETALELRALAELLGSGESTVLLGRDATERGLAEAGPEQYRYLAFATHAVMAGEIPGLAEPAIVLTPNDEEVPFEGLLTASDVAAMRLDADLVLLSACNTAAPEGGPYAEGLSGLARAFLQAGARRLLVSHWAVNSQAAVLLTTAFVAARTRDPGARPAAHLQEAMRHLLRLHDGVAGHPAYWAPFVIVGG